MSFAASSVLYDMTAAWLEGLREETSAARKFSTDSSNTDSIPFDVFWKALCRTVNDLNGITSSTAEINKSDGIGGYALAHQDAAGKVVESTLATTVGGSLTVFFSGRTTVDYVSVTPVGITAAPGTSLAMWSSTITGATVTVDQWKMTSDATTTLTRASTTERSYNIIAIGT